MLLKFAANLLILGEAFPQFAIADPSIKDLAARTELHPIETLTVLVRQFLTGDKNKKTQDINCTRCKQVDTLQ
jgi:hypothetical protein